MTSYEIITPLRVNDFGESFPQQLHYRRRRRSLDDGDGGADGGDGGADGAVSGLRAHYRLDAFGQRLHLNLSADSSFIGPAYTVQHLGMDPTADHHDDDDPRDPGNMRHCFFRGHVNAQTHLPAVFSLCTGLVSMTPPRTVSCL